MKQAQGYLEDPEWYKSAGIFFDMCIEVWPDMSGATSVGCPVRNSKEGNKVDFEELYSDGRDDTKTSLFRSRVD